jgi:uncharacterized protein
VTDISALGHAAAGAAAVVAGTVNAIAGGGTLISFPVLTAIGVPTVRANATNTVSLCPGYIGGTWAQRDDLRGLGRGLRAQMVAAAIGGLAGSILLITTSEAVFRQIVPFLILTACALLAVQDRMRAWLTSRSPNPTHPAVEVGAVGLAAVYGGYFGAGLGIMLVAVLGLLSDRPFLQLNAVKQLLSFLINTCAAAFLVFSGKVEWSLVLVMAPGALLGGSLGGRLARSLPAAGLRSCVIVFGIAVAIVYLVR